jgi:hypothetical protein
MHVSVCSEFPREHFPHQGRGNRLPDHQQDGFGLRRRGDPLCIEHFLDLQNSMHQAGLAQGQGVIAQIGAASRVDLFGQ